MRRFVRVAFLVLAVSAPLGLALHADASVGYDSPYSFEQTFGTATRLVRVDMGFKITEKDVDNGFLLFEYKSPESGSKISTGSVEIIRGKERVHVAVQLPALPRYHEQIMVDALAKKLAEEHGDPPKKVKPAPATVDDAGSDAP
jgi:hypothetical protein